MVFPSLDELFQAAARKFAERAGRAIEKQGSFSVALAGGSTPKGLYSLLASQAARSIPWDKIRFFWGDERHVGPSDPESNYRMVYESLLSKVPVDPANVFRVRGEEPDAAEAARSYEQTITNVFHLKPGEFPRFDLILLGMGPDGHTASLFPGSQALSEQSRLVVANRVEKFKTHRITFTFPVLNHAASVLFLVAGKDKAAALSAVFDKASSGHQVPAKRVQPVNGELIWMIEREAAQALPEHLLRNSR